MNKKQLLNSLPKFSLNPNYENLDDYAFLVFNKQTYFGTKAPDDLKSYYLTEDLHSSELIFILHLFKNSPVAIEVHKGSRTIVKWVTKKDFLEVRSYISNELLKLQGYEIDIVGKQELISTIKLIKEGK